jgi:hypothetical protein
MSNFSEEDATMANLTKEIPDNRPDPGGYAAVFVPCADADEFVLDAVKNGSGMAGFANGDGTITVYFENNRFADVALGTWQSKVFKAYDRLVKRMPTTSKLTCDNDNLQVVGVVGGGQIVVSDMAALNGWLERTGALATAPEGPLVQA